MNSTLHRTYQSPVAIAEDGIDPPIYFSGPFSWEEWNEFERTFGYQSGVYRIALVASWLILFPYSLYSTYLHFVPSASGTYAPLFWVVENWAVMLGCGVFLPLMTWWGKRRLRVLQARQQPPFDVVDGSVSGTGITQRCSLVTETLCWEAFSKFRFTPHLIALYCAGEANVVVLARSRFSADCDWEWVQQLVTSKLLAK